MSALHAILIDNSQSSADPVVFLHGFGSSADQWRALQTEISFDAPTLAFDLPGHGQGINYPDAGPVPVAAKAVLAELEKSEIKKAHFVGHSMGGAIASLIALIAPQSVTSLTLLAPGGFGDSLNSDLLVQWAGARERPELEAVMPEFFGPSYELPEEMVDFQLELRNAPHATEKLQEIAGHLFDNGKQATLPVADVLAGDYPVSVIWGTLDKVLPVSQARAIDGKAEVLIVDGMGHSPAEEAPEQVLALIRQQL